MIHASRDAGDEVCGPGLGTKITFCPGHIRPDQIRTKRPVKVRHYHVEQLACQFIDRSKHHLARLLRSIEMICGNPHPLKTAIDDTNVKSRPDPFFHPTEATNPGPVTSGAASYRCAQRFDSSDQLSTKNRTTLAVAAGNSCTETQRLLFSPQGCPNEYDQGL